MLVCKDDPRIVIDENQVLQSLNRVKVGKAAGPDKISSKVVSICKEQFAPILCKIFQQSIDSCTVPKLWKTSEIVSSAIRAKSTL